MEQDENKVLGYFLIWIAIHLLFLLVFSDGMFSSENMGTDNFWPFCGDEGNYDITEFLFYTIVPPLVFFIIYLFASEEGE